MSTPFDYSKWDNIELSDDEDDVHPNIDRESWFRMKHRSRVEREEREEADKKKITTEIAKANLRIKEISKILSKASASKDDSDSDSDDELEDLDGLRAELQCLQKVNAEHEAKLEHYDKNKRWNVDNMCHVVEERTIVNNNVGESKFSTSGYALPKGATERKEPPQSSDLKDGKPTGAPVGVPTPESSGARIHDSTGKANSPALPQSTVISSGKITNKTQQPQPGPKKAIDSVSVAMLSYHEFTEKYADVVEEFMAIQNMDKSKEFLLQKGDILLQENASNYLLLASLEDEMNGYHDKMRLVARQSQIISNIVELAKSLKRHPGNVIVPFFQRLESKELYGGFMDGVEGFIKRIEARAVQKRKEMDEERAKAAKDGVDVSTIPLEERLGPGGLDPLEVFESLPLSMQEAFESREREKLQQALLNMSPEEAEYHMKRCIDAGLWNA